MQATQRVAHRKKLTRPTRKQTIQLWDWWNANSAELDSAPAWRIAQAASNDLDFDVSPYTIVNIRKWRRMENRVSALEAAIERQELNPIA